MTKYIFCTKFGSHLYGTEREGSDIDFRGVFLPSAIDILMQEAGTESKEIPTPLPTDTDFLGYSWHHFLALVASGETNALNVAFAPEQFWYTSLTDIGLWEYFVENRSRLLSRHIPKHIGYCKNVVSKFNVKPERMQAVELALNEVSVNFEKYQDTERAEFVFDDLISLNNKYIIETKTKTGIRAIEVCNRKIQATEALGAALRVVQTLHANYSKRIGWSQRNENTDFKALSHAIRIAEEGKELLETGMIVQPRPNADYLLRVKFGQTSYIDAAEYLETTYDAMLVSQANSILPPMINGDVLPEMVEHVYRKLL